MSSIILTLNEWRTKGHYPLFLLNKPIGASPRHDYVLTRMILLLYYILYTVWIGTSKKGGNAPRATDKKSMVFWSSAVIVWRYLQYLPNNLTWELNNSSHVDLCIFILNTEGKLGRQIRYFKIGGSPLFPKEGGGASAPFCTLCPPFEGQKEFPPNFQKKEFPRNLQKVFPPNRTYKIPNCGILAKS